MATNVKTDLASRMYGQVAVRQLESLGELALDVATAYARHFRITGQSCSLLMLESEADYQRFDIKPEDDLFVIKTRDAKRLINTTLENNANELADPKQQLVGWLRRLVPRLPTSGRGGKPTRQAARCWWQHCHSERLPY